MPIRPFQALLLQVKSERVLIVGDLHIGWEASLAQQGIHIPSQAPKILSKLLQLIKSHKPKRLILLGDVKHAIAKMAMEEWRDVPALFDALLKKVPAIQIVPGNHDGNLEPLLPESVKILSSKGVVLGNFGLFHGHAWLAPELLGCKNLIMGHVHPVVAFRDTMGFRVTRQVWVKARCYGTRLARILLEKLGIKTNLDPVTALLENFNVRLQSSRLLIMPSFNDFLGGESINKNMEENARYSGFIGPVLNSGSVDIGNAEVYLLDGTFLGVVNQLRKLS